MSVKDFHVDGDFRIAERTEMKNVREKSSLKLDHSRNLSFWVQFWTKKISYPDQFNEIKKLRTLPDEHVSAMSFEDVVLEIVDADVVAKRTRQLWNIKV